MLLLRLRSSMPAHKKGIEIVFSHRSFDGWNLNPGTFSAPSAFGHVSKVCWWRQDTMPQHLLFGLEGPSQPWFLLLLSISLLPSLLISLFSRAPFSTSISWWYFPPDLLPLHSHASLALLEGGVDLGKRAQRPGSSLPNTSCSINTAPWTSHFDGIWFWMRVSNHGLLDGKTGNEKTNKEGRLKRWGKLKS